MVMRRMRLKTEKKSGGGRIITQSEASSLELKCKMLKE